MSIREGYMSHWQDAGTFLLGIWLFFSPWLLGFTGEQTAAMNAYIVGAAIAVIAAGALYAFHRWEEWLNALLAVWLIISPFVLGYSMVSTPLYNAVIVGLLVLGLAYWAAVATTDSGREVA